MDFFTAIDQWDYSTIYRLIAERDTEPGLFDFKEVLSGTGADESKKQLNDSIRKTVCSMANADGGYIIFGIKDSKKYPRLAPEERIRGIPKSSEYLKEFGNKISSIHRNVPCVYPERLIDIPGNETHGIFVIHIPLSPLRPHMIEGTCYKRVGTGSAEPMDWHEVRDQMLYTEGRLQKVKLLRLKIAQFKNQIAIPMGQEWMQELARNSRYDTNSFEIVLADVCDLIPFQLLEHLVKLSRTATDLNIIMDPTAKFKSDYNRSTAQVEKSNLFGKLCGECEEQLADLFGSLTKDNI
jgi:hypothetical protein